MFIQQKRAVKYEYYFMDIINEVLSLKAQEHYMNIENLVQTLSIRNFKLNSFKV